MTSARDRLRFELQVHQRAGLRRLLRSRRPGIAVAAAPVLLATPAAVAAPAVDLRIPITPNVSSQLFASGRGESQTVEQRQAELARVSAEVSICQKCKLCEQRTTTVPGEGCLDPPILFIGEGPGAEEDRTGRPFVGKAGQLLDKMIAAIQLRREQVYIANIVKCRPPGNRTPEPDEVRACMPFLERQIAALRPTIICTLGLPATRALIPDVRAISAVRGRPQVVFGVTVVPTFHPAYLLRNPAAKTEAWQDFKQLARLLGIAIPVPVRSDRPAAAD